MNLNQMSNNVLVKAYQKAKEEEKRVKEEIKLLQEEFENRREKDLFTSQIKLVKTLRVTKTYNEDLKDLLSLEDLRKCTKLTKDVENYIHEVIVEEKTTRKLSYAWTIRAIK